MIVHSAPVARLVLDNGTTYELLAMWEAYGSRQGIYMSRTPHYMPPHYRLCQIVDVDFCLKQYGGTLEQAQQEEGT